MSDLSFFLIWSTESLVEVYVGVDISFLFFYIVKFSEKS